MVGFVVGFVVEVVEGVEIIVAEARLLRIEFARSIVEVVVEAVVPRLTMSMKTMAKAKVI